MLNNGGKSPSHLNTTCIPLTEWKQLSTPGSAKTRGSCKIICIGDHTSHLWRWKREMAPSLHFVLRKLTAMGRSNLGSPTFHSGTGYGKAQEWWQCGEMISPTLHASHFFSRGRIGSVPIFLSSHHSALQGTSYYRAYTLDCLCVIGRASLYFLFLLAVHSWGWTKCTHHTLWPQSDI